MDRNELTLIQRLEQLHELHFALAAADTIDEVCLRAVRDGRVPANVDRFGLWFRATDDPDAFVGSYGIDEHGEVRDERSSRIARNPVIYDSDFFQRRVPFRHFPASHVYDDTGSVVGDGDLVVAPLWTGNESIGALSADNYISGRPLDPESCHLVALLARMVAHVVTMKRTEQQLRANAAKMERLATTDDLTGFLNRRTGMQILEHQIGMTRRGQSNLTVCFIDIDRLKVVNDTHGHLVGDRYITTVTELVKNQLRDADVVVRMGGDEFMVVLPGSTAGDAKRVIERVEAAAAASDTLAGVIDPPWFSYGLAEYRGTDQLSRSVSEIAEELISVSDMEMYRCKRGR